VSLGEDLEDEVDDIFGLAWEEVDGRVVPFDSLTMANDCHILDATVLYADLDESTRLVDDNDPHFAAEVYKAYLKCASKIIVAHGGDITAFDGDRVMAVFLGEDKNNSAVRAALKLNYARHEIINPAIAKYYKDPYTVNHVVGIDTSELHVVKSGVRGSNDLVWVGRAANHAAKLCSLSADYPTRITQEVFADLDKMHLETSGESMWSEALWKPTGRTIYRSTWTWAI
jgi:class 3 adenylate cyclase